MELRRVSAVRFEAARLVLELYPGVSCDGFIQALLTHKPLPAPIRSLHELTLE